MKSTAHSPHTQRTGGGTYLSVTLVLTYGVTQEKQINSVTVLLNLWTYFTRDFSSDMLSCLNYISVFPDIGEMR